MHYRSRRHQTRVRPDPSLVEIKAHHHAVIFLNRCEIPLIGIYGIKQDVESRVREVCWLRSSASAGSVHQLAEGEAELDVRGLTGGQDRHVLICFDEVEGTPTKAVQLRRLRG